MFVYSREIDEWSYDMIKDFASMWGDPIIGIKPSKEPFVLDASIAYLDDICKEIGREVFDRLSMICGIKIKVSDIRYFVNTVRVSLHNGKEKFISLSLHHPLDSYRTIFIHEIFHVYFYQYLYCDKAKSDLDQEILLRLKEGENEIKEYLTVIINQEFEDIIDVPDQGYPEHVNMRESVLGQWRKEGDWIDLLTWIGKNI